MHENYLVMRQCTPDYAREAAYWVELGGLVAGLTPIAASEIALCALEAINNSIEHAYSMVPGEVRVQLEVDAGFLTVIVTDHGRGLPETPPFLLTPPTGIRGRGAWLMSCWCDEVRHVLAPGIQQVVLIKKRTRSLNQEEKNHAS